MAFKASDFLKAAGRLKTDYIQAEELGLEDGVWIRELTGSEREQIMRQGGTVRMLPGDVKEIDMSSMKPGTSAKMACFALIEPKYPDDIVLDEDGIPSELQIEYEQMFAPNETPKLHSLGGDVLDVISRRVRKLSGMDGEAIEEKKEN